MGNEAIMAAIAKPKKFSAPIYRAPLGTALPTDSVSELNEAFKSIGSVSEDGFAETTEREIEEIKRWGGDVVLVTQTGKKDQFTFTPIDYLNDERLKMTYGDGNVTGTVDTGLAITSDGSELTPHSYVVDEILTGGILQRTVIPKGVVSEVGEMTHDDSGVLAQEVTLTALSDDDGVTFKRYIKKNA